MLADALVFRAELHNGESYGDRSKRNAYAAHILASDCPDGEPTAQALRILAACAVPVLPIALGLGGAAYAVPKNRVVAGAVGALLGAAFSVVMLRGKVVEGTASFGPA